MLKQPERTQNIKKGIQAVFADPSRHRAMFIQLSVAIGVLLFSGWIVGFLLSLYFVQTSLDTNLDSADRFLAPHLSGAREPAVESDFVFQDHLGDEAGALLRARIPDDVYALIPKWSERSLEALERQIASVDVILPELFTINWVTRDVAPLEVEWLRKVMGFVQTQAPEKGFLPVVNGFGQASALVDPSVRAGVVAGLGRMVSDVNIDGACLDYRWMSAEMVPDLVTLLADVGAELSGKGKTSCVILRLNSTHWPLAEIGGMVDKVVLDGFDQPERASRPVPIAPHAQFTQNAAVVLQQIAPEKTVFALGNVAYDWITGELTPLPVTFSEVARLSGLHRVPIELNAQSLNPSLAYIDAAGRRHQIWFTDAVSAHNQLRALHDAPVGGVAIWPLNAEDPGIWALLDKARETVPVAALLREVSLPDYVGYAGTGDFLTAFGAPQTGVRMLGVSPETGLIETQIYTRLPETVTVARWGAGDRNAVALTFDDGPDKTYTPLILDILREYNVPAAFFIVGERALLHPDIVKRTVAEGHLTGVHTFTHPNIEYISGVRLLLEANGTQRLLASITGENTVLFRAPYGEDSEPHTEAEARPLVALSAAGYVTVGTPIDPRDWDGKDADTIVSAVRAAALAGRGNTVLLHDTGGDLTHTLEALPLIIEGLRADGFTFVSLETLMTAQPVDLMPDADARLEDIDAVSFAVLALIPRGLVFLFGVAIVLGILRSVLIVGFAYFRRPPRWLDDEYKPSVTVLISAFTEESVIANTVSSVLASDYENLDVLVIDDGSTDHTLEVLINTYGSDSRVRIVHQKNRGKAQALNHGYRLTDSEIVVAIDADTMILPDGISRMVRHFSNPAVGAVAGNAKVGNRTNLVTRLQAVEYITSQNLDRQAFERFNAILVVPGAIGAWRREVVAAVGGYSSETLAEDADLTVAIIRAGYLVTYEKGAIAMTEAPKTLEQLYRQRLRWTLGIMQTGWKHKGAVRELNGIGLVALPNILVFGVILSLFAPVADIVFIGALSRLVRDFIHHPTMIPGLSSPGVFIAYAAYLMSDVILSGVAFMMEPKEDKRLILWVILQRFFYRQLLYVATLRSLWRALTGHLPRWRKLNRTGDVSVAAIHVDSGNEEVQRDIPAAQ